VGSIVKLYVGAPVPELTKVSLVSGKRLLSSNVSTLQLDINDRGFINIDDIYRISRKKTI
jgi:hypothetical protein